jgi:hypothetical protein
MHLASPDLRSSDDVIVMPWGKRPRLLFLANFLFVRANRRPVSSEQAALLRSRHCPILSIRRSVARPASNVLA